MAGASKSVLDQDSEVSELRQGPPYRLGSRKTERESALGMK